MLIRSPARTIEGTGGPVDDCGAERGQHTYRAAAGCNDQTRVARMRECSAEKILASRSGFEHTTRKLTVERSGLFSAQVFAVQGRHVGAAS